MHFVFLILMPLITYLTQLHFVDVNTCIVFATCIFPHSNASVNLLKATLTPMFSLLGQCFDYLFLFCVWTFALFWLRCCHTHGGSRPFKLLRAAFCGCSFPVPMYTGNLIWFEMLFARCVRKDFAWKCTWCILWELHPQKVSLSNIFKKKKNFVWSTTWSSI